MGLRQFLVDLLVPLIRFGSAAGPVILAGSGTPEAAVAAPVGSLYLRDDGGTGTSVYRKESGTGNTGWVAIAAGGGGGAPGGSAGQVQFNSAGSFAGASEVLVDSDGNLTLKGQAVLPAAPPAGEIKFFARERVGMLWPEVLRPSGRDFPLQPHLGVNRIGQWLPNQTTTVTTVGMPHTKTGTISHPNPDSASLKTSTSRWRETSSATAGSTADERGNLRVWRGNTAGFGGWTYSQRFALNVLAVASVGYFGLHSAIGAFGATQALTGLTNTVGFGFRNGTDTNWQVVHNDASGAATLVDTGIAFNTTDLLTIFIAAKANDTSIFVRMVNETTGASFDHEITTDMPVETQHLSVRNYLSNVAAATAVSFESSGVYIESDY